MLIKSFVLLSLGTLKRQYAVGSGKIKDKVHAKLLANRIGSTYCLADTSL